MLKVPIADDEENGRDATAEIIKLSKLDLEIVGLTNGVQSTIAAIKSQNPDLVLLDIEMGDGTAFDVLKQFPVPSFKVIFITAYKQYAIEAFRFSALDYLLKPIDPFLLIQAINKVTDNIEREKMSLKLDSFFHNMNPATKEKKKISLRTANTIHVVNIQDIMHCEAERSYTNFHLVDKTKLLVSRPLDEFDSLLTDFQFVRIHRSHIVNINYIKRYEKGDGGSIILSNGANLPVSARKKDQIVKLLANL